MKKSGFTLAEVLITLGIIGVVSALTTPALINNVASSKIGPSLSHFVNIFETGMQNMMAEEDMSIIKSNTDLSVTLALLTKYINLTPYTDDYVFTDANGTKSYTLSPDEKWMKKIDDVFAKMASENNKKEDGTIYTIADVTKLFQEQAETGEPLIWKLKTGEVLAITTTIRDKDNPFIEKGAYKGIVAEVLIDIDGDKSSNKAGKDVYGFLLDRTGVLVPVGSMAHHYVDQSGKTYITNYSDKCSTTSSVLNENFACTGKIADNKYSAKGLNL